jgi:hypothetical protein
MGSFVLALPAAELDPGQLGRERQASRIVSAKPG